MKHFANLTQTDIDAVRRKLAHWPSLRQQDVEDILSDSLYALAQKAETEAIRIPQAWLLRAAKFNALNHRRRRGKQQCLVEPTAVIAAENPTADAAIVHAVIKVAMRDLPIDYQRIIELCDFDQLTVTAAARELGVCRSTAQSWRNRAINRMRRNSHLSALFEEISG